MDNNKKIIGSLPTDGRGIGEYKSIYPIEIRKKQKKEAVYISFLIAFALVIIFLAFLDIPFKYLGLSEEKLNIAVKVIYCTAGGLLGGASVAMKLLYRTVARGRWHEDRIFWRYFSPLLSIPVSLAVASIFAIQILHSPGYFSFAIGFLAGYFADEAVGKMYDIALVIFSRDIQTRKDSTRTTDNIDDNNE